MGKRGKGLRAPAGVARLTRRALWVLFAVGGATSARAHHSFAMYDHEHQVRVSGLVTSFIWANPHVYIQLVVEEDRGTRNTFTLESASPAILKRQGWDTDTLKPGEMITAIIAPLRNGDPGGLVKELILPDGRHLSDGTLVGEASID